MKRWSFLFVVFTASCTIAPRISVNVPPGKNTIVDGKLFTTAFQQRAAEYRALCYQAFNIAHLRVDQNMLMNTSKPRAIMTDVDETVLNNSAYQAHQVLKGEDYTPDSWTEWVSMASADTVPGAVRFLQYAASKGIEIFYVTNRDEKDRDGTLRNLQKFNFPNSDNAHLLLRGDVSSKEMRKQNILKTHDIILLMGDNMNDLSNLFEGREPDARMKVADAFQSEFGKKFIVLPNPVYGDWENSIYKFGRGLTPVQKDSLMRASMYSY
jgi:5'-nucleotidase (lipoprotein e(P4) family)